jgi:predicted SprT family Zn-dependent metalloprotease
VCYIRKRACARAGRYVSSFNGITPRLRCATRSSRRSSLFDCIEFKILKPTGDEEIRKRLAESRRASMNSPASMPRTMSRPRSASVASSVDSDELEDLLARLQIHRSTSIVDTTKGTAPTTLQTCCVFTHTAEFEGIESKSSNDTEVIDLVSCSSYSEEEEENDNNDDNDDVSHCIEINKWARSTTSVQKRRTVINSSSDEEDFEGYESAKENWVDTLDFPEPKSVALTTEVRKEEDLMINIGVLDHHSFSRVRTARAAKLYKAYNAKIFDNKLPHDLEISWNKRLATTAGLTHYGRKQGSSGNSMLYYARIELSCKVIDTEARLERTLVHEMCHCAAWLIDHVAKPPHGAAFKKWAVLSMRVAPHLEVSTCHQYEIFYSHQWQCSSCHQSYGRHSNSIDVTKKVCGRCRGRLTYLGKFTRGGMPATVRQQSAFQRFVKDNFSATQENHPPNTPASVIMKALAVAWRDRQKKEHHQRSL